MLTHILRNIVTYSQTVVHVNNNVFTEFRSGRPISKETNWNTLRMVQVQTDVVYVATVLDLRVIGNGSD